MNKNNQKIILGIVLFLLLGVLFFGISYSIFTYFGTGTTNNMITTGKIVFSYSDVAGGGNGIKIENVSSIPDDLGKVLSDSNEYFDFTVTASTTTDNIAYEVIVEKDEASTLLDEYVKIYLTSFEGDSEVETPLTFRDDTVVTYDQLADTTNQFFNGKTVYYGTVQAGEVAYGRKFRLRMWVKAVDDTDFDYSLINDKFFSIRVNVVAAGTM